MAYIYTELDNGELLVEDPSKGLSQVVPTASRPFNLIYIPSINNVAAVHDLSTVEEDFQHIKVVK